MSKKRQKNHWMQYLNLTANNGIMKKPSAQQLGNSCIPMSCPDRQEYSFFII